MILSAMQLFSIRVRRYQESLAAVFTASVLVFQLRAAAGGLFVSLPDST
jgi:hypothetical protein